MSATFRLAAWTPPLAEAATFYPALGRGDCDEAGLDLRWLAADGSPAALDLIERGLADAVRRPSRAAEMIARHAVDGQDGRRNRAMLALRLPLASPRPGGRAGWFDPVELEAAGRILATHGLLARPIDPAGCFTNDVAASLESSARWAI